MSTLATPSLAVRFGKSKRIVAVASFAEASQAWVKLRDENNLASRNSPSVSVVALPLGNKVATVSYNGCVWGLDGKEIAI